MPLSSGLSELTGVMIALFAFPFVINTGCLLLQVWYGRQADIGKVGVGGKVGRSLQEGVYRAPVHLSQVSV